MWAPFMNTCKHCKLEFDISDKPNGWMANHSRWCKCNPKRSTYCNSCVKGLQQGYIRNKERIRRKLRKAWKDGKYSNVKFDSWVGKTHSVATKLKMSQSALRSDHRRLVKSCRHYVTKRGDKVLLDSSWEELLAIRLDALNIDWIRPPPLTYEHDGKIHKYFPDFYLPKYDLYLDPKNPYAIKIQSEKISILLELYPNIRILSSKSECKNFTV